MIEFDEYNRRLLFKESSLAAMNIGVGLTFLRKYDFVKLGFIYQAFFSLSIGIERLIKLVLVYEYFCENGSFPNDNKYLKSKGHDLLTLVSEVEKLAEKYNCHSYFTPIRNDEITRNVLSNLSDFAVMNRYFYLDELSNAAYKSKDPLKRWDLEVHQPILKRHYQPGGKKQQRMSDMARLMDNLAIVRHVDEQDNPISSYSDLTKEGFTIDIKQKYSVLYTFYIVRAICNLQENQNRQNYSNAALYEFFVSFRNLGDSSVLKRKSWNPYSPYKF